MIAFSSIKLSILLLYLRLFGMTHKRTRICVIVLIGLVLCIGISGLFGFLFLCDPVRKLFMFSAPGQCNFAAINKLSQAQSFLHVFTDILITIVPMPMVIRLRLPMAQRVGIVFIMATGLIVTIFSILRLNALFPRNAPPQGVSVSIQYGMSFWSILELNVALVCTSAPALKQFVGGTFPAVRRQVSVLTSKMAGGSGHSSHHKEKSAGGGSGFASRLPWTNKSAKWDTTASEESTTDGIIQETSISMDRRVKDGSYVEMGPVKPIPDATSRAYGPTTHVSAGSREIHSTSSREPIVQH